MTDWEKTILIDMKPFILLGEKYDLIKAKKEMKFSNSELFPNSRYINFTDNGEVALTYTVFDNAVLISNNVSIHQAVYESLNKGLD